MTAKSRISSEAIAPVLRYRNLDTAVEWLCETFDFEVLSAVEGRDGRLDHAELSYGNGTLLLGTTNEKAAGKPAGTAKEAGPVEIDSAEVQSCYVLVEDINALRARASSAELDVVFDIKADKFVGRSFGCKDLEGNIWYFGNSTSGSVHDRSKRGITVRSLTGLAAGLLVILTFGVASWFYVSLGGVVGGVATHVDQPAVYTPKKERRELENGTATTSIANKTPSTETMRRRQVEISDRNATRVIRQPGAQRKERADDTDDRAEVADQAERSLDEANAHMTSDALHLPEQQAAHGVLPEQAINNKERVIVEDHDSGDSLALSANEKMQTAEPAVRWHGAVTTMVTRTRLLLTKARDKRIAAQSSFVADQAPSTAVRMENRMHHPPGRNRSAGDSGTGKDHVAPESTPKPQFANVETAPPSPTMDVDEAASGSESVFLPAGAARRSLSRLQTRPARKRDATVPSAETSTAIENARRLAEKLRQRQIESRLARIRQQAKERRAGGVRGDGQRQASDMGRSADKASDPEAILRRAFIARW